MAIEEYVFVGKNNDFTVLIEVDDVPVDFTTATRFVLTLDDDDREKDQIVIDTDIDAGSITGGSDGKVVVTMGLLVTDDNKGVYTSRLCVYDPLHVEGQIMLDWCATGLPNLSVMIC